MHPTSLWTLMGFFSRPCLKILITNSFHHSQRPLRNAIRSPNALAHCKNIGIKLQHIEKLIISNGAADGWAADPPYPSPQPNPNLENAVN